MFVVTMQNFNFRVANEDFESGYGSHISLGPRWFHRDINNMEEKNKVLIDKHKVTLRIDYPLKDTFEFEIIPADGKSNFTRFSLVNEIFRTYQKIYKEEKETTTLPVETVADRAKRTGKGHPMMLNRASTDGTYGIWGHELSDLVLCSIYYNSEKNTCTLSIDS